MNAPHRLGGPATLDCDVLIIGAGAGGATLADKLTAAGRDVVLLEEGPYVPAAFAPTSVPDGLKRLWRGGGLTVGFGNPPVAYAEGRCVGGGTEINSAIMQRTPDDLLDMWAEKYNILQYGAANMAAFYDEAEKRINASVTPEPVGMASNLLKEAGAKLNWKVSALKRAQKNCMGTNLCSIGCPTGGKQSMSATAIPAALARGLRLIAECRVKKLDIKENQVRTVTASAKGADGASYAVTIHPKHVFVCAGAVHTPALLLRSGLKQNIGQTLRMHPTIKTMAQFDFEVNAEQSRLPLYAITEFMPDKRIGGSVFLPGFFGMALGEDWQNRKSLLPARKNTGMYYAMARAEAKGSILPLPLSPEPLVRYQCTPHDLSLLQQGLFSLAEAMFAVGAKKVIPSISGHEGWRNMDEVRIGLHGEMPRSRTNLMTIHIFSSCVGGENPDLCATDSFGRVRGIANLTVADASQIPEAPGVNPQLTVMAVALRAAHFFLSQSVSERHHLAHKEAA